MRLLVKGASEVVRVTTSGELVKVGKDMKEVHALKAKEGEGLSIAVDQNGLIAFIGTDADLSAKYSSVKFDKVIDARGQSVIPGLVDAHTHPVWAGNRVHEFAMKLGGASYMEIHEAGGGIHFTVRHTREADEDTLLALLKKRLNKMSKTGTTLVECKSGYGLNTETEMKMLRVLEVAKSSAPLAISSTYCGAHAVPKEMTADEATKDVVEKQIPALAKAIQNNQLQVDNIDVFCEKGVYDVNQTRSILKAGRAINLNLNFHAEELNYLGGVEMGASLGAEAMSHLEEISEEGIKAMADVGSVAVLLPTTAHLLRLTPPPARKMIEMGVPVALGSDFNPNAYCSSMPFVMSLACVQLKMSLEEALVAATLNAAHSVRKSHVTGSLEVGKRADLVIVKAPRWEHLVYQLGESSEIISYVIHKGNIVHSNCEDVGQSFFNVL